MKNSNMQIVFVTYIKLGFYHDNQLQHPSSSLVINLVETIENSLFNFHWLGW